MQTIDLIWFVFFVLMGASVGSFLNVVIYRLPAEKSLVHPGSHCPLCGHKLSWWENIPILAWMYLRAKCSNCKAKISAQYVIIESITAALFGAFFWLYYLHSPYYGGQYAQLIYNLGANETWPIYAAHMVLIAGLLAATIIDFRYFIIPVEIPWFVSAVGLALPIIVWRFPALGYHASLGVTPDPVMLVPWSADKLIGPAIGAVIGVGIAKLLVEIGVLPRSFDMLFDVVSDATPATTTADQDQSTTPRTSGATGESVPLTESIPSAIAAGDPIQTQAAPPPNPGDVLIHHAIATDQPVLLEPDPYSDQPWPTHPHPRREVMKEALFLLFPLVGYFLGMYLWQHFVLKGFGFPADLFSAKEARWDPVSIFTRVYYITTGPDAYYNGPIGTPLRTLGGVCLGYIVGGGMIWITRILGTLGFGKEAVGLGDVYLMSAIGAILGATMSVYVYFLAPFLGLGFTLITLILSRFAKGVPRVLPYGPFLALATVILMIVLRGT